MYGTGVSALAMLVTVLISVSVDTFPTADGDFGQWTSEPPCSEPTLWVDQIRKVVYAGEMTEGHNSRIRTKTTVKSSVSD